MTPILDTIKKLEERKAKVDQINDALNKGLVAGDSKEVVLNSTLNGMNFRMLEAEYQLYVPKILECLKESIELIEKDLDVFERYHPHIEGHITLVGIQKHRIKKYLTKWCGKGEKG